MKTYKGGFVLIIFIVSSLCSYSQSSLNTHYTFSKINTSPVVPLRISVIPPNYYSKNLGFFCKKEIAFEKVTRIPFKFRLGSIEYCNYLEGKK